MTVQKTHSHSPESVPAQSPVILAKPILPDRLPMVRHLDPAAALAYRTPMQEHLLSADGKAAGVLTLLGIMFTVLARCSTTVGTIMSAHGTLRTICMTLMIAFALLALGAVLQAFRTISPRFPKAPPSLAFFGDIARLSRDEYVTAVEKLTPAQAIDHMLTFNHTSACICVEKFRQLKRGLQFFEVAFVCWLPLIIILTAKALIP